MSSACIKHLKVLSHQLDLLYKYAAALCPAVPDILPLMQLSLTNELLVAAMTRLVWSDLGTAQTPGRADHMTSKLP